MTAFIEHEVTNESHRTVCAECTVVWADLERISAEAKALPQLTPSRDLWAAIETRIGTSITLAPEKVDASATRVIPQGARAGRRWNSFAAVRLATAASLLVATTAAITWQLATARVSTQTPAVALATSDSASAADEALAGGELRAPEKVRRASYEENFVSLDLEIRTMQSVVDRKHDELDPHTIEVLERSLLVIDQAIAESRAAFLNDPASRFLASQLARSYASKLTLLRSTATMPTGI